MRPGGKLEGQKGELRLTEKTRTEVGLTSVPGKVVKQLILDIFPGT